MAKLRKGQVIGELAEKDDKKTSHERESSKERTMRLESLKAERISHEPHGYDSMENPFSAYGQV